MYIIYIYIYIYIFIHWIQKILTAKNIYIRHFEICYVILLTQIHHMLNIYAKVVMRRPNPKAYGHFWWMCFRLNGQYRFKMADIYICMAVTRL